MRRAKSSGTSWDSCGFISADAVVTALRTVSAPRRRLPLLGLNSG